MSNVNNWQFAKNLDNYKAKVLEPQTKRVADAKAIMDNPNHPWKDEAQKNAGKAQYESYKAWLTFYQQHYDAGMELVKQHENIVNLNAKWYQIWRDDISNDGLQETEMMSMQADFLNEIFSEMYRELLPLKLDIKAPKPLNFK
jgi:hypothetical protein